MPTRLRADRLLVQRGLFESRAKAQAAILAGLVTADERRVLRPSDEIPDDAVIAAAPEHPYVSRGGVKLAAALNSFNMDPADKVCLDVGASTGGFTDVLLRRGATRVFAVDVGQAQLHPRLRADPRVVSLEATDIRILDVGLINPRPAIAVIDVSFISLKLALPPTTALAAPGAALVALIKPQFEAGRAHLKRGIVRDAQVHALVCADIAAVTRDLGWRVSGVIPSPITGGDGNCEFLLGARRA